jgi:hypothetical protein
MLDIMNFPGYAMERQITKIGLDLQWKVSNSFRTGLLTTYQQQILRFIGKKSPFQYIG